MNNINYTFTEKEVEAVASIIKFVKENGSYNVKEDAKTVSVAFNREAFKLINVVNNQS